MCLKKNYMEGFVRGEKISRTEKSRWKKDLYKENI